MTTAPAPAGPAWSRLAATLDGAPAGAEVGVAVRVLETGASFGHHDDRAFPAASTVKLLILAALARAVDAGRLRLDDRVPILPTQRVGGSGVLNALETPLELSVRDHAWLMTAISDNSASNVLVDAVGMAAIHDLQASLALGRTALNRHFMRRSPGAGDNIACAGELVAILAAIDRGTIASPAMCAWMLAILGDQQVTDRLARRLPEGVRFAGKSGWQTGISHDAGLLRGPGGAVAVAVLTQGIVDGHEAAAFIGAVGRAVAEDTALAGDATSP